MCERCTAIERHPHVVHVKTLPAFESMATQQHSSGSSRPMAITVDTRAAYSRYPTDISVFSRRVDQPTLFLRAMHFPRARKHGGGPSRIQRLGVWAGAWDRPLRFIVLFQPAEFAVVFLFALGVAIWLPLGTGAPRLPDDLVSFEIYGIFFAPFFETLFLSTLVFEIAFRFHAPTWIAFGSSWIVFAGVHLGNGVWGMLAGGVVCGFFLCCSYTLWRRRTAKAAFWVTVTCHALHNFIVFGFINALLLAG